MECPTIEEVKKYLKHGTITETNDKEHFDKYIMWNIYMRKDIQNYYFSNCKRTDILDPIKSFEDEDKKCDILLEDALKYAEKNYINYIK